jgi:tetratricopeptide (TPR) repeat protein
MQPAQRHTFGALVRQHRRAAAMTQAALAAKAGLSVYSISNIERGVAHIPRKDTVDLLAQALQLNERARMEFEQAALHERRDDSFVMQDATPLWGVPIPRNPFFIGRDDMLRQIHVALHSKQAISFCQSCTLSGMGGMGKTQTAVEYAYRYASAYSAVFWIQAETAETISASIVAIARLLDLPEQQEREQQHVMSAVSRRLAHHGGWLLIFDNVEDVELVKTMLPPTHQGAFLFTTRRPALSISAHTIILEKMTAKESLRFLLHRARLSASPVASAHPVPAEEAAAQAIVAALDGLPLALDQAGAYIEATRCSLDEYLRLFRASPSRLLDEREPHADHPLSVFRTVTVACEQCDPQAAALLTACAFLAPEEIPEQFFIQGAEQLGAEFVAMATDPFQFQTAVKTLLTYSLVQRQPATQTVTIHRLVQVVVRERLSKDDQRTWVERVTATMAGIFPPSDKAQPDYWQACERLLPHALVCIAASDHWSTDVATRASLMNHVAHYLANLARFDEAKRLHRRVLQMSEQMLGMEHPLVAEALSGMARSYKEQGNYMKAESLVRRALEVRERVFGAEHPRVADSLSNLAVLYVEQKRYDQAEVLHQRALRIREQSFDAPHPLIASSQHNLANVYMNQENYEQAEIFYRRALQMWEQSLGAEHPKVALPMAGLAEIYQKRGKLAEAEPLFLHALHIIEHAMGAEHPDVVYLLNHLGDLYSETQRYAEAEGVYRRILHIRQCTFDVPHSQIAEAVNALADLYMRQGRHEEAELVRQQSLTSV